MYIWIRLAVFSNAAPWYRPVPKASLFKGLAVLSLQFQLPFDFLFQLIATHWDASQYCLRLPASFMSLGWTLIWICAADKSTSPGQHDSAPLHRSADLSESDTKKYSPGNAGNWIFQVPHADDDGAASRVYIGLQRMIKTWPLQGPQWLPMHIFFTRLNMFL